MAQEIEKKFLVKGDFKGEAFKATRITQGYLSSVPERTVRVRVKGDKGFITIKGIGNASGAARFEWEKEIPVYSIVIKSTKPGTKTADITETKAYGVAQISDILTINEFAKHIAEHGTLYSRDVIQGVLIKMVDCMRELLLEGKKIQLGDLGSFGIGLSTKGANTAALFTAENIKKVNVNWERGKLFKNLRDDAIFNLVPSRKAQEDALADAKRQETLQPEEDGD